MKTIKRLVVLLCFAMGAPCDLPAATQPPSDRTFSDREHFFRLRNDGLEFSFEPSFRDGLVVFVIPPKNGKAQVFAYKLHRQETKTSEFHSFNPTEEIAKAEISEAEFDSLVALIENRDLHRESERTQSNPDSSLWLFRRQAGGRLLTLRFFSPQDDSTAAQLGERFLKVAKLDPQALKN